MMPLWSSYLVKVYAWKLILAKEGIVMWLANGLHLSWLIDGLLAVPIIGGPSLSFSYIGTFLVFVYIWLPYMILPTQAALERVPINYIEASADLGAEPRQTFRTVIFPLALPGIIAGSIFTFSLTLGDYIMPTIVGNSRLMIGQAVYTLQGTAGNIPLAAAFTVVPMVIMGIYLLCGQAHGGVRCALTRTLHAAGLRISAVAGLLFLHLPLGADLPLCLHHRGEELPVPAARLHREMVRRRLVRPPGYLAAALSLVEGRSDCDLPGADPRHARRRGAVARQVLRPRYDLAALHPADCASRHHHRHLAALGLRHHGHRFSTWTIVLGHATFCIVVVYNNVLARFRRTSGSMIEASMDLGADGFQTFRHVVLPQIGTALLAGGMLAFALSFDEVIVTTFTAGQQSTLPIWMLKELIRPRQRPVTNVVAIFVIVRHHLADPRRLLSDARGRAHRRFIEIVGTPRQLEESSCSIRRC